MNDQPCVGFSVLFSEPDVMENMNGFVFGKFQWTVLNVKQRTRFVSVVVCQVQNLTSCTSIVSWSFHPSRSSVGVRRYITYIITGLTVSDVSCTYARSIPLSLHAYLLSLFGLISWHLLGWVLSEIDHWAAGQISSDPRFPSQLDRQTDEGGGVGWWSKSCAVIPQRINGLVNLPSSLMYFQT